MKFSLNCKLIMWCRDNMPWTGERLHPPLIFDPQGWSSSAIWRWLKNNHTFFLLLCHTRIYYGTHPPTKFALICTSGAKAINVQYSKWAWKLGPQLIHYIGNVGTANSSLLPCNWGFHGATLLFASSSGTVQLIGAIARWESTRTKCRFLG